MPKKRLRNPSIHLKLLVITLLTTVTTVWSAPSAADSLNRFPANVLIHETVGSDLPDVTVEVAVQANCDELTDLGTVLVLNRNGEDVLTRAFNLLTFGDDDVAACRDGDPADCASASSCSSFFPNSPGEPLRASCEAFAAFGRPAACLCTARRSVLFADVALTAGDHVTVRVRPAPSAAREGFTADDTLSFDFNEPGVPACVGNGQTLCLQRGRFRLTLRFADLEGDMGPGWAMATSPKSGYFWFFEPENTELAVKVLDGRALNGAWWVFAGGLSDLRWELTVTDTLTGNVRQYVNDAGESSGVVDKTAFQD